jgi:type III restriction enzyme
MVNAERMAPQKNGYPGVGGVAGEANGFCWVGSALSIACAEVAPAEVTSVESWPRLRANPPQAPNRPALKRPSLCGKAPFMSESFFERPIINSPYELPARHWELDADGQPTNRIIDARRRSDLVTPVPKPRKRRRNRDMDGFILDAGDGLSSREQEYNPTPIINEVRNYVDIWRNLKNPEQWQVTPETARLLQYWRHHEFSGVRPFFCQIEAVETAIWLVEVAPKMGAKGGKFLEHLERANARANPELLRLALKLATGAGKTTVMAMLVAWQTVNAIRHPNSRHFSRGFLVVAPGITIRDRLQVLLPNDPQSYYRHREIVPPDMLRDIDQAKIVIANYHAFKLRERLDLSKGTRQALEGWRGEKVQTL